MADENLPHKILTKEELKQTFQASLYTQLIINGLAPSSAMERAKEAADVLFRENLPFPDIKVG